MEQKQVQLEINKVELDDDNPRIKSALEKYGDKLTPERIFFALRTGGDEGTAETGFHRLQHSIIANGEIAEPIKVVSKDGRLVCIDGNTRLAIYRELARKNVPGDWDKIPTLLIDGASQVEIEKIRVTAHLVGARPWPAYEKAKYLYNQYYHAHAMSKEQLIELCGGNGKELQRQIYAYDHMEHYYRPRLANESDFNHTRFSGFIELQKPGIQEAIFNADFTVEDFADWIIDGRIHRLEDVRQLPKVLADKGATKVFVEGGVDSIKKGIRIVNEKNEKDDPDLSKVSKASLQSLVRALDEKIAALPFYELQDLKKNTELLNALDSLSSNIASILKIGAADADVGE